MKIIFSRKGFDNAAGGVPSPVFEDGSMFSFPIPDYRRGRYFGDLNHRDLKISEVVKDLTKGRIQDNTPAHLDPDLVKETLSDRHDRWRGAFGQTGAAQSHLERQGVGIGDVFVFFGWFDHVRRIDGVWKRVPSVEKGFHAIFGWLQIGEILRVASDNMRIADDMPWLSSHPHVRRQNSEIDTIYVGSEFLTLPERRDALGRGFGAVERLSTCLRLSKPEQPNKSLWRVPHWMSPESGRSLSYHADRDRWSAENGDVTLKTVGRGQEFVIDVGNGSDVEDWLRSIICGD